MYKEAMTLDYTESCTDCIWRIYSEYEDCAYCNLRHHTIRLWGTCEDFERKDFDQNNLTNLDYSI